MIIDQFNKKDWVNWGRWVQPPISGAFWCYWSRSRSVIEASGIKSFGDILFLDGHTLVMEKDIRLVARLIRRVHDKDRWRKFLTNFDRIADKYARNHLAVLNQFPNNPINYISNLFDTYRELAGIWTLSIFFGDAVQKFIIENSLATEQRILTSQKFMRRTWLENQSQEISQLAHKWGRLSQKRKITLAEFKKQPRFFEEIKKHIANYCWYGSHHWVGNGYNLKMCLGEINHTLTLVNKKSEPSRPQVIPEIIKFLNLMTYWRTHCAEVSDKVVFLSRPVLKAAAKRLGLSYDQLVYLTASEILSYLGKPSKKLPPIVQRKKAYGCYLWGKKEFVVSGPRYKIWEKRLIDQVSGQPPKSLKGMVACRGDKITARVRKIISPQDVKKFQAGEILVASETTPDFVPCMKKAAAIITDRGGIPSHAAIVSRELGVPCIIATKVATQVLKDGMMITVDTTAGIIKIV